MTNSHGSVWSPKARSSGRTWVLERAENLVSHHLRVLRDAGLVESRRDGKMVLYSLTQHGRAVLKATLAELVLIARIGNGQLREKRLRGRCGVSHVHPEKGDSPQAASPAVAATSATTVATLLTG